MVPIFKKIANKDLDSDIKSSMKVVSKDEYIEFNLPTVARKRNKNFANLDYNDAEGIWFGMIDDINAVIDKANDEKDIIDNNLTITCDGDFDETLSVYVELSRVKEIIKEEYEDMSEDIIYEFAKKKEMVTPKIGAKKAWEKYHNMVRKVIPDSYTDEDYANMNGGWISEKEFEKFEAGKKKSLPLLIADKRKNVKINADKIAEINAKAEKDGYQVKPYGIAGVALYHLYKSSVQEEADYFMEQIDVLNEGLFKRKPKAEMVEPKESVEKAFFKYQKKVVSILGASEVQTWTLEDNSNKKDAQDAIERFNKKANNKLALVFKNSAITDEEEEKCLALNKGMKGSGYQISVFKRGQTISLAHELKES